MLIRHIYSHPCHTYLWALYGTACCGEYDETLCVCVCGDQSYIDTFSKVSCLVVPKINSRPINISSKDTQFMVSIQHLQYKNASYSDITFFHQNKCKLILGNFIIQPCIKLLKLLLYKCCNSIS